MAPDRTPSRIDGRSPGRGLLSLLLWMPACVGVAMAADATYGPSSRRSIALLLPCAAWVGGFIILKLTWASAGARAREGAEGPRI